MIDFLKGLFGRNETRALTPANFGLEVNTPAGVWVTETNALNNTAVLASVRAIAEPVASLPLNLYERLPRGKRKATSHPLYRLMHDEPNEAMTAYTMRETLMAHVLLWGNAYAYVERDPETFAPTAIFPLLPDRTQPERRNGKLVYVTHAGGQRHELLPYQVLHVPGLGWDGTKGYSVISLIRNAVAIGQAAEEFGARFFNSDGNAGAVLKHPGVLSPEAAQNLRNSVSAAGKPGLGSAFRVLVLQEGMSWERLGTPPEDGQFLQTRQFQVSEIARAFKVQAHKVGDLTRSTNNNIEHQSIEFVTDTLRPWLVRWEQELNRKLLATPERDSHFFEHNVDGLLRGDTAARTAALATRFQNGIVSREEWREIENLNAGATEGDSYYINGAMVKLDAAGNPTKPEPTSPTSPNTAGADGEPGGEVDAKLVEDKPAATPDAEHELIVAGQRADVLKPVVLDVLTRLARRDAKAVANAAEKYAGDDLALKGWLATYSDQTHVHVAEALTPVATSITALTGKAIDVAALAEGHITGINADVARYYAADRLTRRDTLNTVTTEWQQENVERRAKEIMGDM